MTPAPATRARRATSAKKKNKKQSKGKRVPACNARDLRAQAAWEKNQRLPKRKRKKLSKPRKCRVVAAPTPVRKPSPTGPVAAPPAVAPVADAFPTAPAAPLTDGLRTYAGPFGVAQAQRLLFRAGFGPKPGQAEAVAALGLRGAVDELLRPGAARRVGPEPGGFSAGGLAPEDFDRHLHLDMLDRQIRSTDQLGERMTLVLHDWFAVSAQNATRRHVSQHIDLLRAGWRGSFRQLLLDVTKDPAMLEFLDGTSNRRGAPNENYARELMELYALGADRGAYTEDDVRELARALTGFRNDSSPDFGPYNFRWDPARHDAGVKTVFPGTGHERTGRLTWEDAVHAVVDHPLHPSFVVRKLWSSFIPTEPTPETQRQLEALYRSSGERLEPLIEAILLHPDLHAGPAMVKPPVVFAAGLFRACGLGLVGDVWSNRVEAAGQLLGYPPSVAGWNDRAWLNTSTHRARWAIVQELLNRLAVKSADYVGRTETPTDALDRALAVWGNPVLTNDHLVALRRVSQETWSPRTLGDTYSTSENFLAQRQNVLRQLVCAVPDLQVS